MDKKIFEAIKILKNGGLVAIPTETVYGLAADADNEKAVAKIYTAKNRPSNHPLIVHLASAKAIDYWVREKPKEVELLTQAFWPGPLTLVLKRSLRAKDFVTGSQDTVALRCPSHPLTRELLCAFDEGKGNGLTAPSANTFGRISPTTAEHVKNDLGDQVDLILDGGPCSIGIESTILDLSSGEPRILREGAITAEMIEAVINKKVFHGSKLTSPRVSGSLKSHYAPNHPLEVVDELEFIKKSQFTARHFQTFGLIAPTALAKRFSPLSQLTFDYSTVEQLQRNLYEWLHQMDSSGVDKIFVIAPVASSSAAGVLDRLSRAAVQKE